jgi:RecB family exonuclease
MTVYSHSRLAAYEKCPLSYKYKYIDKIKPEIPFIGIEAYMGTCVHGALEHLYRRQKIKPAEKMTFIELLDKYESDWKEKWKPEIKIVKEGKTEEDYFTRGKQILSDYYQKHRPFDQDETLSVEERMDITIEGFKFMGFIDRVAINTATGNLEIHDYKTSGTLPEKQSLQNDRQLALYQIGVRKKYPSMDGRIIEIVYHYLNFSEEFRFQKTDSEIEAVKSGVVDLVQTIELAAWENKFDACVGKLCRWCEFSSMCPAFQQAERKS